MTEAEALIRLQELDIQLLRHASTLASMPQQKKLKTVELAKRRVNSELNKIVGQRKDVETEMGDVTSNLDYYNAKTEEVKADAAARQENYRQIQDLEASLTSLAKKAEKCEHRLGELDQSHSKLKLAEKNAHLTLDRLDQQRETLNKSFEDESAQIRREIVSMNDERNRVVEQISPETMERYDAARTRFKGLAVEVLHGNVPSVCRVKLQPASYHDLMHGPEVSECPYCHRILIVRGPLDDEEDK